MASVFNLPNGRKGVEFYVGGRYRVRLGKCSAKSAATFAENVDRLTAAKRHNVANPVAERWADGLDKALRDVLEDAGLVEPIVASTLRQMVDGFAASLTVKASTMLRLMASMNTLMEHFLTDQDPRTITPLLASEYRAVLTTRLAGPTIAKRIKDARQAFAWAQKMGVVDANPFADVRGGNEANPERNFFVTREVTDKVLNACPNAEWRLLVALSRYGGLRCPSEHLALRWEDVLWNQGKFRVREGKTKERWVKLFLEVRAYLLDMFKGPTPTSGFIIDRKRKTSANLRTQFMRIIRRAGLKPWPRIWHNLRASRQTELVEAYPMQVVCEWIGNSEAVALRHYLMVPDHFYADARGKTGECLPVVRSAASAAGSKLMAHSENNAGGAAGGTSQQPQQGSEHLRRRRGLKGRPDQNGGIPGELLAMSDAERMRRALAAIEAFCTGEVRK